MGLDDIFVIKVDVLYMLQGVYPPAKKVLIGNEEHWIAAEKIKTDKQGRDYIVPEGIVRRDDGRIIACIETMLGRENVFVREDENK